MRGLRYLLAAAAFAAAVIALGFVPPRPHGPTELIRSWEYAWTDDATKRDVSFTPLELPAHPNGSARFLLIRTTLPKLTAADPVLAFDAINAPYEAYADGRLIETFPSDGLSARWAPGTPWQVVSLPPNTHEVLLVIRASGVATVVRGTPQLGARADLLVWVMARDIPRVTVGLLVMLLGALGVVFAAGRNERRLFLGYTLTTTLLGVYVVNYTHIKDILFDAPRAWFWLWAAVVPLQQIGSYLFTHALFGGRILKLFLRAHIIAACALALAYALATVLYFDPSTERAGVVVFGVSQILHRTLILVSFVAALIIIGRRAHAKDVEARLYLVGYGVLFAFVARDVVAALGVASLSWKSQVHLGAIALTIAMIGILGRRYTLARSEAILRLREKELLLRDLHDGVGSLTSNVRVLAELGQKSDARAKSALVSIADLSGRALNELRSFVSAMDEAALDWGSLAADLRRFGAQLVESTGARFTMTVLVERNEAERPPPLLALNLVRIAREAFTNALKSGCTEVNVALTFSETSVRFRVENDRGASQGAGIDQGRGLGNMRARATDLGGAVIIEAGERFSVELTVPLPIKSPIADGAVAL